MPDKIKNPLYVDQLKKINVQFISISWVFFYFISYGGMGHCKIYSDERILKSNYNYGFKIFENTFIKFEWR